MQQQVKDVFLNDDQITKNIMDVINQHLSPRSGQVRKKKNSQPKLESTKQKQPLNNQQSQQLNHRGSLSQYSQQTMNIQIPSTNQNLNIPHNMLTHSTHPQTSQNQQVYNTGIGLNGGNINNIFNFDLKQYQQPMSPQINSFISSNTIIQGSFMQSSNVQPGCRILGNALTNVLNSNSNTPGIGGTIDYSNTDAKQKKQNLHRRTQSKSQYAPTTVQLTLKQETFEKKSLDKIKKSQPSSNFGGNQGESTEDQVSNMQSNQNFPQQLKGKKLSNNFNLVATNNQFLLQFSPDPKKTLNKEQSHTQSDLISDNAKANLKINQNKRLTEIHQTANKIQNNLINNFYHESQLQQQLNKKVQFSRNRLNDEEAEELTSLMGDLQIVEVDQKKLKLLQKFKNDDSEQDDDEEELKEEVGDLPPKIEDLQVEEYDDNEDIYQFGRGYKQYDDEEDDENNDAPTVVYDDNSIDIKEFSDEDVPKNTEQKQSFNQNIEFALKSIKLQEDEEDSKAKKKKVTILSVEEEEDLVAQINDIRDKIKRGETIGQQKEKFLHQQSQDQRQYQTNQSEGQLKTVKDKEKDLQAHFRSVDQANGMSRQQNAYLDKPPQVMKPPLYSLTFAHPHDPEKEQAHNPLAGISQKQAFHSIDQNAPTNCIIMDGPNIFEKKKQRFEKIQKMRGNLNHQGIANEVDTPNFNNQKRSRDDITPNGGISSSISANIPSSQKKSIDSTSQKGSIMTQKANQVQNTLQKPRKCKTNKSTVTKIQNTLKPLNQSQGKSRQISNIHQVNPSKMQPLAMMMLNQGQLQSMDDAVSNSSKKRNGSKSKDIETNNIILYSLKKGNQFTTTNANRQATQSNIKKKLLHKSKKHLSTAIQPYIDSGSQSRQPNNLLINVTQEQQLIHSSSFKKMKTPKLKLADDLLQGGSDLSINQKRLSEFQLKLMGTGGGQTTKNTSSTLKNPFFSELKFNQKYDDNSTLELVNVKSLGSMSNDKRATSNSFHKVQKSMNQVNLTKEIKSEKDIHEKQVVQQIDPTFMIKLIKSKQESDHAFDVLKKKLSGGSLLSNALNNFNKVESISSKNSLIAGNDRLSFMEFEKKYKKLSNLISKMLN
ncbi:UNKNOWN [Stylonychia lemnae]|uniref:Uncharacterized protein n=1 Tax=Stylonychia lemnae TaxID=5949 RepID=A0A078AQ15_STYLE|nr:UNKNOWN [Stylonychia lemnae]|eukprot:CDW84259.1 UNKNOWN [Stylonychia lemnae]